MLEAAVKKRFPGATVTRCERGKVDIDHVLGVNSFSLDKALEVKKEMRLTLMSQKPVASRVFLSILSVPSCVNFYSRR